MLFLTLLPHIVEERADFGPAARHFVDAFWADKADGQLTKDQKSKLQREQVNEFRRRYGTGRSSSIFFLAKENDEILGCAGLEIEREATMSNLAVAVAGRRQGLAQALVKACEQRTRDAGLTELGLVREARLLCRVEGHHGDDLDAVARWPHCYCADHDAYDAPELVVPDDALPHALLLRTRRFYRTAFLRSGTATLLT